jgi:hypothetical protein
MSNARYGFRTFTTGEVRTLARKGVLPFVAGYIDSLFGMPTVALSMRRLTSTATNCIRVRRSNDNAEQDIGFVSTAADSPIDTTDLLTFVGAGNDGFVTTWYNQNTTVVNAVQSTGANQPKIVDSGSMININSLPSIKFDGSNDRLDMTSLNVANIAQTTIESVYKLNSTSNNVAMTISTGVGTSGQIYLQWTDGGNFRNFYRNQGTNTTPNTSQMIMSFYSDGTNAIFYQDTTQLASYAAGSALAGQDGIIIGAFSSGLNSDSNFQEVIIWDAALSSIRADIQTNIDNYYNVL